MNKPSPVKSILVMEDLSDWKVKIVGTMLSQNEIILCLKNIACMHARFWGEKKKDIDEFLKYVHTSLFRKKRFMLDEKFQQNASKFAIFYRYDNPKLLYPFFISCYFTLPLINALVYVVIDQGIY